jgi:hypothetical protein
MGAGNALIIPVIHDINSPKASVDAWRGSDSMTPSELQEGDGATGNRKRHQALARIDPPPTPSGKGRDEASRTGRCRRLRKKRQANSDRYREARVRPGGAGRRRPEGRSQERSSGPGDQAKPAPLPVRVAHAADTAAALARAGHGADPATVGAGSNAGPHFAFGPDHGTLFWSLLPVRFERSRETRLGVSGGFSTTLETNGEASPSRRPHALH